MYSLCFGPQAGNVIFFEFFTIMKMQIVTFQMMCHELEMVEED